jgi:hypothetical protein
MGLTHSSDAGETLQEMAVNFSYEVSVFIFVGFFNMSKNHPTWNRQLYSPLKEVVLLISDLISPTLGLVASTLPTRPPRASMKFQVDTEVLKKCILVKHMDE